MEVFLLIISIILILFTFISIKKFLKENYKADINSQKKCLILSAIVLLLCVLDFTNIVNTPNLNGFFSIVGLICCIILVSIHFLDTKISQKKCRFKFLLNSILGVLILELFVFNFNSFHTLNQDIRQSQMPFDSASISGFVTQEDGSLVSESSGSASIEYTGFSTHIQTLTVDVASSTNSTINCRVDYNETPNVEYRSGIVSMEIINNDTKSQTIPTYFSGDTSKIKFNFNIKDNEVLTIKGIYINQPYGVHFSITRYLIILILINIVYYLINSANMKSSVSKSEEVARKSVIVITTSLVILSIFYSNLYRIGRTDGFIDDFKQTSGNQITQEIVDAFANGQVELLRPVEEDILNLENPYDWSQRDNVSYAWDHVMYNGKYYSYYGVAPVLLIFLPYFKLTGYYFPSMWAVFIFCVVGIVFLSKLYYQFVKRFFSHIPVGLMNMGLIILQLSTGVWFCMAVPNFYEIAQSSGFACVAVGAYMMLSSNVIDGNKIVKWRVALSTIFLSLGVLCRPTLAVYCIVSLIFLLFGWKKIKSDKKETIKYLSCALIPFIIIGGFQMWYNYARFGSILDFGIQYSLTINDFTNTQYHTHFVTIGLYNFLLAIPSFTTDFPFFQSSLSDLDVYGYYFVATNTAMGLIYRALPILAYGYSIKAYRNIPKEKKFSTLALILPLCVIAPAVIIFSIWESGYGVRYEMDFTWQLLFGAYAIMFAIYNKKSKDIQTVQYNGFIFAMIVSLLLNFAQVYTYTISQMTVECQESFYKFAHLFEFWL